MAADLSARMSSQATPAEAEGLAEIEREGVETTPVTELLSMASAAKTLDPLLVSLKAVDPAKYPFYGEVELEPAGRLADALTPDRVAVADDLLVRLRLQVGDSLKIGNRTFRIGAVVVNEPDRLSGSWAGGACTDLARGVERERVAGSGEPCGTAVFVQGAEAGQWRADLR
jgi:putative ABC transport system permease protein